MDNYWESVPLDLRKYATVYTHTHNYLLTLGNFMMKLWAFAVIAASITSC